MPVVLAWCSFWSGHRVEACLKGQYPPLFVLEGLLLVDEPLVLLEQHGSVLFGDEVACLYQFAVVSPPFFEKGCIALGPATCRDDDVRPGMSSLGLDGGFRPRVGGAEAVFLLLAALSFFFAGLPEATGLPVAAVGLLVSSLAAALRRAWEDELPTPSPGP